jgi:hypothetical protein
MTSKLQLLGRLEYTNVNTKLTPPTDKDATLPTMLPNITYVTTPKKSRKSNIDLPLT